MAGDPEAPPVRVRAKATVKDGKVTIRNPRGKSPDAKSLKVVQTPPPKATKGEPGTSGQKPEKPVRRRISFSDSAEEFKIQAENPAGPVKVKRAQASPMSSAEADAIFDSLKASPLKTTQV